jgi:hypothetical protein
MVLATVVAWCSFIVKVWSNTWGGGTAHKTQQHSLQAEAATAGAAQGGRQEARAALPQRAHNNKTSRTGDTAATCR